jgi:hypothetical protein
MTPLVLCLILSQPQPVTLTVTAASPPRNLYRWQLLPGLLVQKPGDAVEGYKKATATLHEIEPDRMAYNNLINELERLRTAPLADVDRKRVKEIVEKYKKGLDLIAEAARCEQVNWDPLIERIRKSGLAAALTEEQSLRNFLPFLAVQARHHLLEDRPEEAVQVAATTLSLARHANECPTLVCHFVALACAQVAFQTLQDCIQHPKCPSLYGSLTDLPRPFLSPRLGYEGERLWIYGSIPVLSKLVADPAGTEVDADTVEKLLKLYHGIVFEGPQNLEGKIVDRITLAAAMQKKHDAAKEAMRAAGYDEKVIEKTPILNAGLLHALLHLEEGLGRMAAAGMLPYPQAQVQFDEIHKKFPRKPPPQGADETAYPLVRVFLPAGERVLLADLRSQRQQEMLRLAEGLRQHAAQTGKWPDKLDDVKVAPLPNDPATGKPFAYKREDNVAVIDAPLPNPGANKDHALTLRLTLRKPEEKKP